MPRVAHKKSRRGCATCKQRHVKCDEARPGCINCTTVHRRCAYLDEVDAIGEVLNASGPLSAASSQTLVQDVTLQPPVIAIPPGFPDDLLYVHALNQWMSHTQDIFCPSKTQSMHPGTIILNYSLKHPFLLHGLLALSTFHLSYLQPHNRENYLEHSKKLLSQGLEEFNGVVTCLNETNIIPAFIFSTVAGYCRFTHVFSTSHRSVEGFLESLSECITMFRGVNIVLEGWWGFITTSSLFQALYPKNELPTAVEDYSESDRLADLRRFLQESKVDASLATTYAEAVNQLQSLYNSQKDEVDPDKSGTPEFVWFMKLPGAFHTLVLQRRPEALLIVVYLAPLLHRRRRYWLVGNAGEVLLNAVCDFLGPDWQQWLKAPQAAIGSDP